MSDVTGALGTRVSIGPAVASTVDTKEEFEALTFVELANVETITKFGDTSQSSKFNSLTDARVRKNKGPRDAGTTTVTCGFDATDPGQLAAIAAEQTSFKYAWKVEIPDAVDEDHSNTVKYFRALVNSQALNPGGANDTVRIDFELDIDSAIVTDPTHSIP